ncbi:unnamed protein product [Medioppia subpectinata]|uniref:Ig-like domain-containing protein n=1 Tax=Medioppia subpectinata TaxID=1979941 RepID=A0A7R9PTW2_9ACAR|nr:unnamed protein product [Medioppia subpectinata]CAG2100147.1 unnamed protein product [Medioppia subpectinata]
MNIPDGVVVGDNVALSCNFNSNNVSAIYSLKWYKDQQEFYRYVPRDVPPKLHFTMLGVNVDTAHSDLHRVVLNNVSLRSIGDYRCEVSTDGPDFTTTTMNEKLSVFSLPESGPQISGLKARYPLNSTVRLTCTVAESYPGIYGNLTWHINDQLALNETVVNNEFPTSSDRYTTTSMISFKVDKHHFQSGELKVKCMATIPAMYRATTEITIFNPEHKDIGDNESKGGAWSPKPMDIFNNNTNKMSNKTIPSYIVRTMQLSDSQEVRQMWTSLDLDVYKYANEMLLLTDPKGSLVAEDITTGNVLGVCSGVNLSPELSYVVIYAVRDEWQERGIGTALWDKAVEHMGDRNISLFASNDKIVDLNFNAVHQRRRHVMKGIPIITDLINKIDGITLVDMNDNNIADVIEYDKQVCDGLDRSAQLRALNGSFKSISLVAVNDSNQVMGYCFLSKTVCGNTIVAPLYADNQQIAELLLKKCLQRIPNCNEIYYSCWDLNEKSKGKTIANKLGLEVVREMHMMATKKMNDIQLDKIYALGLSASKFMIVLLYVQLS